MDIQIPNLKFRIRSDIFPEMLYSDGHYKMSAFFGRYETQYLDKPEYNPDIMMWTTLLDNTGKEIYHKDIIEITERRYFCGGKIGLQTIRFRSVVCWEDGSYVFSTTQENDSPLVVTDNIRVIGNLWDNPELVGMQKGHHYSSLF